MDTKDKDVSGIVEADEIEALFVQTAHDVSYDNGKLTLSEVGPSTLFFSDRPDRVTGHVTSREFVDAWDQGDNSFAAVPPNGVLSIFHPDGVEDVVVELMNPALEGNQLTYEVIILEGEMPSAGGPTALFIDSIGRPLTPVSAAGMHRRDRRRDRRDDRQDRRR